MKGAERDSGTHQELSLFAFIIVEDPMVGKVQMVERREAVMFCRVLHYKYEQERKKKKKKELSPLNDTGRERGGPGPGPSESAGICYLDDDDNGDNGKRPVVSELPAPFF